MEERIRIRIKAQPESEGWATLTAGGFTVEWDDGFVDYPATRYNFYGDGIFNLEEVTE